MTNNLVPDEWLRKHGEKYLLKLEARKEEERKRGKRKPESPKPITSNLVRTSANLDLNQYIQIPDSKIIISRNTLYTEDKLCWMDSHVKLAKNGLFMPTPAVAMNYIVKVRDALQRGQDLFYADGKKLNRREVQDLWNYLSFNKKTWSWLNARFGDGTIASVKSMGLTNKMLVYGMENPLEAYLNENCFAYFEFNNQGLPTNKSLKQKYLQGQNFYFHYPMQGRVARIGVGSGDFFLNCRENPTITDHALGVFGCAEGERK